LPYAKFFFPKYAIGRKLIILSTLEKLKLYDQDLFREYLNEIIHLYNFDKFSFEKNLYFHDSYLNKDVYYLEDFMKVVEHHSKQQALSGTVPTEFPLVLQKEVINKVTSSN
jgi:hypothetical protein